MAGVFISYRREDAPGHAGRIFDRVRARFGADVVFMDVTAIDAGADFVDAIDKAVGTCDVLLAIIGPQWVGAADRDGHKRLDSPTDFVRLEIAGALKRNVRVVPVLVDDARLPAPADLPDDLQPLLRRNAAELRDARWDADIEQLLASLDRIVTPREVPRAAEPVRSRGRLRALAVVAVAAVSIGAAIFLGPRACASPPATTTASVTPPTDAAPPPAAATQPPAPAPETPRETKPSPRPTGSEPAPSTVPKVTVPDVLGRSLPDARDILRRAGVEVARLLYRDDRTKAVDTVVVQLDVRTSAGSPPAVALTAVARAAIVIHHRSDDADVAHRLLGALTASGAAAGLAIRTLALPAVRPEAIARVTYSDGALAGTAADIAREANAWLAQNDPGTPRLAVAVYAPVVSRTIVIGLPDRSQSASVPSALPDVRGLGVAEARRKLSAAGVTAFEYKWTPDPNRKALQVFDQAEVPGRPGGRTVLLDAYARGTLFVSYLVNDAPIAERFIGDLSSRMSGLGILVRSLRQSVVKPDQVGKVASGGELSREATSIASFASGWLTKELGHTVSVQAETVSIGPQRITLGLPSLR